MGPKRTDPAYDGAGLTQEQIAARLGITRERVGQIERSAMAKMRALATPDLRELLEFTIGV